jgi:hypothetical protein
MGQVSAFFLHPTWQQKSQHRGFTIAILRGSANSFTVLDGCQRFALKVNRRLSAFVFFSFITHSAFPLVKLVTSATLLTFFLGVATTGDISRRCFSSGRTCSPSASASPSSAPPLGTLFWFFFFGLELASSCPCLCQGMPSLCLSTTRLRSSITPAGNNPQGLLGHSEVGNAFLGW